MEKLLEELIREELELLKHYELMLDGDIATIAEKACYDYNMMNEDLSSLMNQVYWRIYGK